jgi:hypothetical protein
MSDSSAPRRRSCDHWHILELAVPAGCFFLLVAGFAGISLMINVVTDQQKLNTEHKILLDKIVKQCKSSH